MSAGASVADLVPREQEDRPRVVPLPRPGLVDTHCHLTHPRLAGDLPSVMERAREAGVARLLTIGTGVEDARRCLALADAFPGEVWCSAGLDPFSAHAAGERFEEELAALEALLEGGEFRALGEAGLDYHHALDPRPVQAERLERQLVLALRLDLPVVIHVREAHEDLLGILARHPRNRGVIHSFSGGPREAERYLALGWHLGFSGIVTFGGASALRQAGAIIPDDRLLVETDSPYLAPVPVRGRRCEPAHLVHTLAALALLRGRSIEELASVTSRNASLLLGLGEPPGEPRPEPEGS